MKDRLKPRVRFAAFAMAHLGLDLYEWQIKILVALEYKRVSAVVCNGGGKSNFIIPAAVLAFLYNWPAGKVMITSGTFSQVRNVIWPALERYSNLPYFRGWNWTSERIDTPQKGFAVGFSTDKPTNLEGQHADLPDRPLMYIVDEAKAIDDQMFAHINRCTPTFYMQVSSACPAQGYFYYSFNKLKSVFWTIKVSSKDCPHVTDEQRKIDRITLDPVQYSMKHDSEFAEDISGSAITLGVINRALERNKTLTHNPGSRSAFCDFAAGGGAWNVLAVRDGNKVSIAACWQNSDTNTACYEFIEHFKRLKLNAAEIHADVGGMGVVMCSVLRSQGWPVTEVNNGSKANDEEHYANRGSEIWFKAADILENGIGEGQYMIVPDDSRFIEQATTRNREYDTKQRLKIESKIDLKARNVSSPDIADAVFGAMVCRPSQWTTQLVSQVRMPENIFKTEFVNFS